MRRKLGGNSTCVLLNEALGRPAKKTSAVYRLMFGFVMLILGLGLNLGAQEPLAAQLKRAIAFHQQSDYSHSVPILEEVLRQSPLNYTANLLLGEDLMHSGNIEAAIRPLELACKMRPQDGAAQLYLADAAASLGDYPKAAEALQVAIARSGSSAPFLEAWASFCLKRLRILELSLRTTKRGEAAALRAEAAGHPEGSKTRESLLEASAAEDPEQRGVWGELGVAQLELGEMVQVQVSLKEAQKREPLEAETLQLEAMMAAVQQNWPVSEELLTALGAKSPAMLRSAVALWQHVLLPKYPVSGLAWDCLRNSSASCPEVASPKGGDHPDSRVLYAEGRWEQLIALPTPAVTDNLDLLWRGVALAETGDCPQAIPTLERGFKADGLTASFWLDICYTTEGYHTIARLGAEGNTTALHELKGDMLLRLRGDAAGAELEYADALKAEPRNPQLLERLAEAYMQLGDATQARTTAQEALNIDPHNQDILQTLAQLAIEERDYANAIVQLKELFAIDPNDAWTKVELGVSYGQLGHSLEAVQYLGPSLAEGYPDKKGALHAMLASALRKLGREQEAQQAAAEAAKLANSSLGDSERGSTNAHE